MLTQLSLKCSRNNTFEDHFIYIEIVNRVEMASNDQRTKLEEQKREILKEIEAVVIKYFPTILFLFVYNHFDYS